jgi:carbon-monoxide dehydrogenase large subunit
MDWSESPHCRGPNRRRAGPHPRAAKASPGVLRVLTGDNLKARGLGTLRPLVSRKRRDGSPAFVCPQPILADGVVRYVADPVAFIVAETLNEAKDATELIEVEYEILPAVIEAEAALAPRASALWLRCRRALRLEDLTRSPLPRRADRPVRI